MSDITRGKKLLFRMGSEVATLAKEKAPYKTGNLKRDIQVLEAKEDEVSVGNSRAIGYAWFVHEGTKPNFSYI